MGDSLPHKRINSNRRIQREFRAYRREPRDEESLVRDAISSREALEELCNLYVPRIYSYVFHRVGRVEDAEDITSAVFEKLLLNLESFDREKASFSTWIYRIALNCVKDSYRIRNRRKVTLLRDSPPGVYAVDGKLEQVDLHLTLVELIRRLQPGYQEALTLRYFGGMKVAEVADVLDISETAASKRILRGLDKLRRLAEGGPLEELFGVD